MLDRAREAGKPIRQLRTFEGGDLVVFDDEGRRLRDAATDEILRQEPCGVPGCRYDTVAIEADQFVDQASDFRSGGIPRLPIELVAPLLLRRGQSTYPHGPTAVDRELHLAIEQSEPGKVFLGPVARDEPQPEALTGEDACHFVCERIGIGTRVPLDAAGPLLDDVIVRRDERGERKELLAAEDFEQQRIQGHAVVRQAPGLGPRERAVEGRFAQDRITFRARLRFVRHDAERSRPDVEHASRIAPFGLERFRCHVTVGHRAVLFGYCQPLRLGMHMVLLRTVPRNPPGKGSVVLGDGIVAEAGPCGSMRRQSLRLPARGSISTASPEITRCR
jgi:hypothetical protein